ncbi:MAG TPA: YukJ family protein [Longimicrobium sp.]|nr:YukJ family protein [Longimicrobium sp.]
MPIENYGVLKGRITECRQERDNRAPHYHIRVRAAGADARVSINVQSHDRRRPDLLHFIDDDFRHPITPRLADLDDGWHAGGPGPDGVAIDYPRGGMVTREQMRAIPHDKPGTNNDLNDRLDALIRHACDDPEVEVYAFGSAWGPEPTEPDEVFGFEPGRGVHDVHMNQGNARGEYHSSDNGVWQDGALFLHLKRERRWVAVFLAFQAQAWQTDDHGFPASTSLP